MLVWNGKIIKKIDNECPYGDYLCEFSCEVIGPTNVIVCGQLFVEKGDKEGDKVSIPMDFKQGEKVYNPLAEDTPVSKIYREK